MIAVGSKGCEKALPPRVFLYRAEGGSPIEAPGYFRDVPRITVAYRAGDRGILPLGELIPARLLCWPIEVQLVRP